MFFQIEKTAMLLQFSIFRLLAARKSQVYANKFAAETLNTKITDYLNEILPDARQQRYLKFREKSTYLPTKPQRPFTKSASPYVNPK